MSNTPQILIEQITKWALLAFCFISYHVNATQDCKEGVPGDPINVMFFQPEEERSQFWFNSMHFAKAVAKDLNVSLQTIEITAEARNRFTFKELTSNALANNPRPDFILSIFYGGGEYAQLNVFNQTNIPFFTFNTSLDEKMLQLTKRPRDQFANWKGHRSPNEIVAGRLLANELASITGGKTIAILAGPTASTINSHRVEGSVLQGTENLLNVIPAINTDWKKESSMRATNMLLKRVHDVDMIWTAGPDIALGAIEVLQKQENEKKIAVGTFDWTVNNVDLINKGLLDVSYGGHFMDAGWAIVMIYDYLNGIDFASDPGSLVLSELVKIDDSNVDKIEPLLRENKWDEIDFRKYSKCLNPQLEFYEFTLFDEN